MGGRIMFPEKRKSRNRHQNEEINGHHHIVGDHRRGNELSRSFKLRRQSGKIDRSPDIGPGHHRADLIQVGDPVFQRQKGQIDPDHRAEGAH